MSAAEIIEQIKGLSPSERGEVVAFVRTIDSGQSNALSPDRDQRFAAAENKVFSEHRDLLNRLAQ